MKELITALVKAKKEFKTVVKNAKNPHYGKMYGNIEAYLEATEKALNDNGLFITQTFASRDGHDFLDTNIYHESGQSIHSNMRIIHATQDPQKLGSLITYYRRYAYAAILNLTAEDDDGQSVKEEKPTQKKPEPVDTNVLPRIEKKFNTLTDRQYKLAFLDSAQIKLQTDSQDATDYQKAVDWIIEKRNQIIKGEN